MGGIIILVSLELRTGPFQRHFRWHIISGWEEFTGTLEIMARGDLCTSRRRLLSFYLFSFLSNVSSIRVGQISQLVVAESGKFL